MEQAEEGNFVSLGRTKRTLHLFFMEFWLHSVHYKAFKDENLSEMTNIIIIITFFIKGETK